MNYSSGHLCAELAAQRPDCRLEPGARLLTCRLGPRALHCLAVTLGHAFCECALVSIQTVPSCS